MQKLFNKNFMLVLFGQGISLFANNILRFALSLYVLDQTGSPAIYAGILAISLLPMILLSPIGGVLADRLNRKNIMVALDFTSALIVLAFGLLLPHGNAILLVGIVLILFSVLASFETPTVQSSIPFLASDENLIKANALVSQINAISTLLGPVLGGFLYGILGLMPVILLSGAGFAAAASIEFFLKIPYTKREMPKGLLSVIGSDFKEGVVFITKEKPIIFKTLLTATLYNLFMTSMFIIGLPVIIKITLGLSSQLYGIAEGAMGAGGILGGVAVGIFANRLRLNQQYKTLLLTTVTLVPIAISLAVGAPPLVSYGIIVFCTVLFMVAATLFSISAVTFIQQQSPNHLVGKVSSLVVTLSLLAQPIGQALYGLLFDAFPSHVYVVILLAVAIGGVITLFFKRLFAQAEQKAA